MEYIGTKLVRAEPMTKGAYNAYRGWEMPLGEIAAEPGYLVEYLDGGKGNMPDRVGYVTWTPVEPFEKAYRPSTAMTFGLAIEAMRKGHKVARAGWNGAGQWVALGAGHPGLPADNFWNKHAKQFAEDNGGQAPVREYFVLKTAQNDIMMGWSPSQSDALAEDWQII